MRACKFTHSLIEAQKGKKNKFYNVIKIEIPEIRQCAHAGRTQLFVEEAGGSGWGFYDAAHLKILTAWLEGGDDAEQELADRLYETFEAHLQPGTEPQASVIPVAEWQVQVLSECLIQERHD